jgi:hypothetical protein
MRKNFWFWLFSFLFTTAWLGCASPEQERLPLTATGRSLSPAQLARYNDSFDQFRDDLYDIAAMTWSDQQLKNLCLAETEVIDGKLRIQTKPGCFSRGGCESKYQLKGSFDVQIDCTIHFLRGAQEIDQIVLFLITGKGSLTDFPHTGIQLAKFAGSQQATVSSISRDKRGFRSPASHKISDFTGTLRIIKAGNRVSTLYKKDGEPEWTKLNTDTLEVDRLRLGFLVRNFTPMTTAVKGSSSITVTFDNLVVNAAEEIIEGEI